ncbi:Oidioi.mRNA.OKI2018_I69.PAR.g9003.t1.cds [Oikopleura dioica]|uniref:Oidioi.mRNA.OKI2018_I69.PAR.g9003.t1.cds n=1 Tax=Oikopleura dioica TaxID=34765 RepID=A0ABN7RMU0_OIKDI|nr:Oidioi.mRNA.OKI2018_I69.PAR.g9003.t1.cds [Oikopleura dioica]
MVKLQLAVMMISMVLSESVNNNLYRNLFSNYFFNGEDYKTDDYYSNFDEHKSPIEKGFRPNLYKEFMLDTDNLTQ